MEHEHEHARERRGDDADTDRQSPPWGVWAPVLLCLLVALPSLGWPAGRDQGIEGATAMLMTQGWVPYRDVWSHSPPGGFTLLAAGFSLLGPAPVSIRIVDMLWMALGVFALARLVNRHGGPLAALVGGAVLALSYYGHGDFWHTAQRDGFMIAPSLLALDLADLARPTQDAQTKPSHDAITRRRAVAAGVCVGVAASFKPGGVLMAVPVLVALGPPGAGWWRASLGALAVAAIAAAALLMTGAWVPMWSGVVRFNRGYAAHYAAHAPSRWTAVARGLADQFASRPELVFAPAGLLASNRLRAVALAYLGVAVVSPLMQASLYPYHFLPLLGPLALLTGLAVPAIADRFEAPRFPLQPLVAAAAVLSCLPAARAWGGHVDDALRRRNATMPEAEYNERFAASREYELLAAHIRANSDDDERVLVWGSDPQLLLLARRAPADRYLVSFPLFAPWGERGDRAAHVTRLRRSPPRFVVIRSGDHLRWLSGSDRDSAGELERYPELVNWLRVEYVVVRSTQRLLLLERRGSGSGPEIRS